MFCTPKNIPSVLNLSNYTTFDGDNQSINGTGTYSVSLLPTDSQRKPIKFFTTTIQNVSMTLLGAYSFNIDTSPLCINGILNVSVIPTLLQSYVTIENVQGTAVWTYSISSNTLQVILQFSSTFTNLTYNGPLTFFIYYY